ncbi:MAG: hypothetical protein WC929_01195 [Bacilli bacterium]|jgi:hypothetical protein
MKKLDYLIIILVTIVSISFYVLYIARKTIGKDVDVQILYQNDVIYQAPLTSSETIVAVKGIEGIVVVTVDGQSVSYQYLFQEDFYNTISITEDEIKMIAASCKNHDCMRMRMNHLFHTPIVCTNGIIVKMVTSDIEIIS